MAFTEHGLRQPEAPSGNMPAVGMLKRDLPTYYTRTGLLHPDSTTLLEQAFTDKGYDPRAIRSFVQTAIPHLGDLVSNLMLGLDVIRTNERARAIDFTYSRPTLITSEVGPSYRGTQEENALIDGSIKVSERKWSKRREQTGNGASRFMDPQIRVPDGLQTDVPIVVLGGGPAGIITARNLLEMGFLDITLLDKTGKYNGIWNQQNVGSSDVSKNNPFPITQVGVPRLSAAPGPGSDVVKFLNNMQTDRYFLRNLPSVTQATVTAVTPGDLDHTVHFRLPNGDKQKLRAPIVINTLGNGKPLPPSRKGYMTTSTPEHAGIRWQQVLTPEKAEKYRDKTLVFIGLGNSTAEMVIQVQKLNRQGFNIDYRILTHYPEAAVRNPLETVIEEGKEYRVYRDKTIPNLVRWEGDLDDAGKAYSQARYEGKIHANIGEWHMDKSTKTLRVKRKDGTELDPIHCDQLFTLIGYGHDTDTVKQLGLTPIDQTSGAIAADYDGEIQKQPGVTGRERLYPGYFANGAMLRSPSNPNAPVIPGIMFRTPDLLFSVAVRAAEYHLQQYPGLFLDDYKGYDYRRRRYLNLN